MSARATGRGFTLLELVLVIAVIGILGTIITPVALASLRANAAILDVAVTVDKLRYASDRLAFEIRELGSGTITLSTGTAFTFNRTDYSPAATTRTVAIDQATPTSVVTGGVSKNQCDGTVRLNYSTPVISSGYAPTLTDQMCSLAFIYYDQTGIATTDAASIRYVEFTLTLQPNPSSQQYAQRTRIALRNH